VAAGVEEVQQPHGIAADEQVVVLRAGQQADVVGAGGGVEVHAVLEAFGVDVEFVDFFGFALVLELDERAV